ncbi:glycosyl transferase [Bordetella genomosp. 12]|uniref:Glycosyl transferase n=2 Tax=Bordetella genomosp. 12 TaxID=463035 RepID=A0A261VLC1_9BORD|nr:glycosyl transferase [Bordetella genomosp. 12]
MDDFIPADSPSSAAQIQDAGLVSVIICAHNAAAFIDKAILSIARQSYRNIEIVAIDDGSEDNTYAHICSAAEINPRITALRIENRGTYAARNFALSQASGRFITFLDADDVMLPRRIEQQVEPLQYAGIVASTSRLLRLTGQGRIVSPRIYPLIRHNPASLMMRREVLERLGPYEEVRFGADDEYEHRIRLHCGPTSVRRDAQVQTIALHHPDSLTQSAATGLDSAAGRQARIRYREAWTRRHMEQGLSAKPPLSFE